jgi:thiosulfate/3-mercaptopyruvate sulfurtransferase
MKFIIADELKTLFEQAPNPILIDMSQPGCPPMAEAQWIDFNQIVRNEGDRAGLLPDNDDFNRALAQTGITHSSTIFLFDDSQGLAASRLAWSLALCGMRDIYLIDGGREALLAAGWPLATTAPAPKSTAELTFDFSEHHCHAEAIAAQLDKPDGWLIIDARSEEEYRGTDRRSRNAGHIPGAVHFDWQWFLDPDKPGYLLPDDTIRMKLKERGITANPNEEKCQPIAVYCQSHRRSSLMFCVLKHLGFEDVRGYPGAWSDWGNRDDLPAEKHS